MIKTRSTAQKKGGAPCCSKEHLSDVDFGQLFVEERHSGRGLVAFCQFTQVVAAGADRFVIHTSGGTFANHILPNQSFNNQFSF